MTKGQINNKKDKHSEDSPEDTKIESRSTSSATARSSTNLLLLRCALSLGSIITALLFVELGMHILGQPRFYTEHSHPAQFVMTNGKAEHAPLYLNQPGRITFRYDGNPRDYFGPDNEIHHDVNPAGFRGPAFKPKREGVLRLVFLGDSFTFGEGVRNQDIYPEVASRLLRQKGQRTESCNLGVGGYNTSQEADVLQIFGFDLDPDVIVLGYTLNDTEPPLFEVNPETHKAFRRNRERLIEAEGPEPSPPDSPLFKLRLAQALWRADRRRHLSKQTVSYYMSLHAPGSEGRLESERALRYIISECRARGIPCIVVMFPILYKLSDDYPFSHIHEQIGEVVREAGGYFVDLLPELKGMDASKLIVHPTDQHPNEKVHEIAARLVAGTIHQLPGFPFEESATTKDTKSTETD